MVSDELKANLNSWFDKRIREWVDLKKLHYSVLSLKKEEASEWQGIIDDLIFTYSEIGATLIDGEGKIRCLPREIKQDIVPFLRRKAKEGVEDASELADIIQNRVPACSGRGTPQGGWLKRRGYTRDDLITKEKITQVRR